MDRRGRPRFIFERLISRRLSQSRYGRLILLSLHVPQEKQKRLENLVMNHPPCEPESYVLSITLRVAAVIVYQIFKNFTK